ncbi:hypothetical protein TEHOK1_19350 [Tetragenococcus halophilus]|nr:hypothetical protein TEHOK1_19350 [Tetragenococcus halophilus]
MMGEAGLGNATFSDSDFGVVGSLVGYIGNVGGQAAVIITVLVALVLLFLASHLVKNHSQKVSE